MMLSIMLSGCSSAVGSQSLKTNPPYIVKTKILKTKVPFVLLSPAPAPDPEMLKGVKVCRGRDKASEYIKALLDAWYDNKTKLEAIAKLEEEK